MLVVFKGKKYYDYLLVNMTLETFFSLFGFNSKAFNSVGKNICSFQQKAASK